MCIYLGSPLPLRHKATIAEEDIPVFKKVDKKKQRNIFQSYVMGYEYEIGYHYTNDNFPLTTKKRKLEGEGMHSYAMRKLHEFSSYFPSHVTLIEAYIPKGTPYYRSGLELISRELVITGRISQKRIEKVSREFRNSIF